MPTKDPVHKNRQRDDLNDLVSKVMREHSALDSVHKAYVYISENLGYHCVRQLYRIADTDDHEVISDPDQITMFATTGFV